jgi:hypothetical protein
VEERLQLSLSAAPLWDSDRIYPEAYDYLRMPAVYTDFDLLQEG